VRRAGRAEPAGRVVVVVAGLAGREVPEAECDVPGWPLVAAPPWRGASVARFGAPWPARSAARDTANWRLEEARRLRPSCPRRDSSVGRAPGRSQEVAVPRRRPPLVGSVPGQVIEQSGTPVGGPPQPILVLKVNEDILGRFAAGEMPFARLFPSATSHLRDISIA